MDLKEIIAGNCITSEKQPVTCQVCIIANADGYCKDCHKFLCLNCFQIHVRFGPLSSHKLTNLEQMTSSIPKEDTATLSKSCSTHGYPLRIYCETCQELICRDCTVRTHKDHNYDLVSNRYNKHHQMLQSTLNAVEKKKKDLKIKITDLADRESEIKQQGELAKQEVRLMADEMIDAIRQSERNLTGEIDSATDSKLQVVMSQKKSAETSLGCLEECSTCTVCTEQTLEMDTHQQTLSSMMKLTEELNVEDYNPIEKCDVQFVKNKMIEQFRIGDISYTTSGLNHCKVKRINPHQVILENLSFSFPLSIESQNSSHVTVLLSSLSCSIISATPINTTVTTTDHPGVYRVHCTPVVRGSHQVNIRVNGIQLDSVTVVVPFNPYLGIPTPIHAIEELDEPVGVAVSNDGCVVVTECSAHCVTILDKEGKNRKSFFTSQDIKFSFPCGIAVTSDNFILVTDNHKIQKITMDGELIASVGQQGRKSLEFNAPKGIAISPTTGQVYVADHYNHRIQVLNADFTFCFSFGRQGEAKGQFRLPYFIAIDDQGTVFVSDFENHRIQIFAANGKFLFKVGTSGLGFGQLKNPEGIAISNGLLYVGENGNNRISIFTTNGKFIRCFGSRGTNIDQFHIPFGIAFDNEGFLYICDRYNNRLVVY